VLGSTALEFTFYSVSTDFGDLIRGYAGAYINASQWRIETCFAQLGVYITLLQCNSTVTCFAFKGASLSRNCMVSVKCIVHIV